MCITHVSVHGTRGSSGDWRRLIRGASLNQRGREEGEGEGETGKGREEQGQRGGERETHDDDGGGGDASVHVCGDHVCLSLGPIPLPSHL